MKLAVSACSTCGASYVVEMTLPPMSVKMTLPPAARLAVLAELPAVVAEDRNHGVLSERRIVFSCMETAWWH